MRAFIERFERSFEPILIVILLVLMIGIIFVQVLARLLDISWPVAEEVARFMFVWAMYLGISYSIRDMRHIRITFFVDKLDGSLKEFVNNCADLIFLLYSILVVAVGYVVVQRSLELGQIAPATEWPVAVVYASVVVGSALNVWRLVNRIMARKRRAEEHSLMGGN